MSHNEYDQGYSEIDYLSAAETAPTEGLDRWELSDFEDLLPRQF